MRTVCRSDGIRPVFGQCSAYVQNGGIRALVDGGGGGVSAHTCIMSEERLLALTDGKCLLYKWTDKHKNVPRKSRSTYQMTLDENSHFTQKHRDSGRDRVQSGAHTHMQNSKRLAHFERTKANVYSMLWICWVRCLRMRRYIEVCSSSRSSSGNAMT